MIKLTTTTSSIGLERIALESKCALLEGTRKQPSIQKLFILEPDNVNPLYKDHPILATGLEGTDVLVRPLSLPLTKEKDIGAALGFQAEPLLPYPVEEALLSYQVVEKSSDGSLLTLFAARKSALQSHLNNLQQLKIEPEKVSCTQSALCQFGNTYFSNSSTYLMLHIQSQSMTCVLIKEGKLLASFALQEGLDLLKIAQAEDGLSSLTHDEEEWKLALDKKESHLAAAINRLQKDIIKIGFAFSKELKGRNVDGMAITGEIAHWSGLQETLVEGLPLPILTCQPIENHSSEELHRYAVPIGLALEALPGQINPIDFRQGEWVYPHPWRRLKEPVAFFLLAVFLATTAFYFFSHHYLLQEEDKAKQSYVDLLAAMGKTPEQFETAYEAKTPAAREKFSEELPTVQQLSQEDLVDRLNFIQKDLTSAPDSFPLFANTPRVSDVLAWLSQHHAIAYTDEKGQKQGRLQIDSFSYMMVKRPQMGKKQEKYQVKIELELSSPTPKWAREFHDALIAPNDWVDPKAEVKWSSNRGKYKTSFFLKDKTIYPGQ